MSHVDSSDDETGTILEPENLDDSKESNKSKKKYPDKHITITYDGDGYETNTTESPDSEW